VKNLPGAGHEFRPRRRVLPAKETNMTRLKTILLSLSLMAGAAAPALAERPTAEEAALRCHDERLGALERQRLEDYLWRHGITGRAAQVERERLERKQAMRDAENFAYLRFKQRALAYRW
jgi:hypothetical protein